MMRKKVAEVTQHATRSQVLKKITAGHELLPAAQNDGIEYILFSAKPKVEKPMAIQASHTVGDTSTLAAVVVDVMTPFRDPFAKEHLEEELFIAEIHGTHNLVLNKFNVVDEHMVLPTIDFQEQENPLTVADLRAMWTCMHQLNAFSFFNCGYNSGASQPHKHMQLISYPSIKSYTNLDMSVSDFVFVSTQPPLLHFIDQKLRDHSTYEVIQLPELPFFHFLHRIDFPIEDDSEATAARLHAIYKNVLERVNATTYPKPTEEEAIYTPSSQRATTSLPVAYNLLLTASFLFVIPRKRQSYDNIEVNSIGFIGSFFVRNDTQRALFHAPGGPMNLLKQVTFPATLQAA